MAKLYFRYGAMNSGKTMDLIKTYYNYKERDMHTVIIKPVCDTKGGGNIITRSDNVLQVNFLIKVKDNIYTLINNYILKHNIDCILVDEAQLLEEHHIDELADIVDNLNIPVICYGLRADFQTKLFTGSKRLFELADSIEEIKTVCNCGKKATCNIRKVGGKYVFEGEQLAIDGFGEVTYVSKCRKCMKKIRNKE